MTVKEQRLRTRRRKKIIDFPVKGFGSVMVFNAQRHIEPKPLKACSFNKDTEKTEDDGKVAILFCTWAMVDMSINWPSMLLS